MSAIANFVPSCGYFWADVQPDTDLNELRQKTLLELNFNIPKKTLTAQCTKKIFVPGDGLVDEPEWLVDEGFVTMDMGAVAKRSFYFENWRKIVDPVDYGPCKLVRSVATSRPLPAN